jgi:hypothetical protein
MWRVIVCLVALVITGNALAQSQRPSPSVGEQRQTEPNPTHQRATDNPQSPAQPPIIVDVLPSPKSEVERADEARERQEKADLDRRLVKFTADLATYTARLFYATLAVAIATICLVLATAGLATLGFLQSRDMKASIAVAAIAAAAAKSQAEIARDALQMTKQQLRAYVSVIGIKILYADGEWQPNIRVNFKNVGQTMALRVDNKFNCTFTNEDKLSPAPLTDRAHYSDLGPDQDITNTALITQADWNRFKGDLLTGKVKFFVYGEITYNDTLGDPHFTRYRVQLFPDAEGIKEDCFVFCPEGNESN